MWQQITESPVTLAAVVNGTFTVLNGMLGALIALGAVALAQRRQNQRDRQAYARKLRDDRRDRLRAACKLIMSHAWAIRGVIMENEWAKLPTYSQEDKQRFYAKLERLDEQMHEARSAASVDVDSERIAEKHLAMTRVFTAYHDYVNGMRRTGTSPISIDELRDRSKEALGELVLAIHEELQPHNEPV
jgi:hypothetical protein